MELKKIKDSRVLIKRKNPKKPDKKNIPNKPTKFFSKKVQKILNIFYNIYKSSIPINILLY